MAKKRYRVLAEDTVVLGHASGEEFESDFDGYDVEALLAGGVIEEVGPKKRGQADEGKEQ